MPKQLSHQEKVERALGKRPLSRNQVAAKLGVSPQAVAGALGKAANEGRVVKTERGYQKA